MPPSVADNDAVGRSGASGPVILETKLAQPRFVCAVAALRTVEPEIGTHALAVHGTPGAGLVEVVLPLVLNEPAAPEKEVVLVLDDYHLITNVQIHEALAFLVERLPSSPRLAAVHPRVRRPRCAAGAGTWRALASGGPARPWLVSCALADAFDAGLTRGLKR